MAGLRPGGPAPLQGGVNPAWASERTLGGVGSGLDSSIPTYGSTPYGVPAPAHGAPAAYGPPAGTITLLPLLPPPDVANLPRVWAYSGSAPWRPPSRGRVALTLGVALAVLAAALGLVLTRHDAPARTLAFSLAKGQQTRYRVQFELNARQSPGHVTRPLHRTASSLRSWRVLGVDAHGVATILERTTVTGATLNGHRLPKTKPAGGKLRMASDGRLLAGSAGVLTGDGRDVPSFGDFGPILPDQPVRPGDSWDVAVIESLPGGQTVHGTLHGTLVRYETVAGVHAAVVTSRLVLPLDFTTDLTKDPATARATLGRALHKGETASLRSTGKLTVEQTAWFDPGGARLVQSSMGGHIDVRTTVSASGRPDTSTRLLGDFSLSTVAVPQAAGAATKGSKAEPTPSGKHG